MRSLLIVGIEDEAFTEKLQLDPILTLEKAKLMIYQREAVLEQQQVLENAPIVDKMKVTPTVISRKWKRGQQSPCMGYGAGQTLKKNAQQEMFVSQMAKKRTLCNTMLVKNHIL